MLDLTIQKPSISAKDIVAYLVDQKFVYTFVSNEGQTILVANQLSIAASQSFLRPTDALYICTELERAVKNICLDTEFHLAYLVIILKVKLFILNVVDRSVKAQNGHRHWKDFVAQVFQFVR